ncbi:MAG: hypothetical protein DMG65_07035 [Candidatus Angelobacter sp. Gp1-AA117]|nr:MAG: hypothetical protein DMG65_07035 [Candidatus Angelobacter sp. Gp1-AA117]
MKYLCPQEERVSAAIQAGQWPDACDPDLRAHAEGCRVCSDVVLVATALRRSYNSMLQAAQPASPGLLWWRAQIRQKNAALERVMQPVVVAEKVAAMIILLAVVALLVWRRADLSGWLSSVWGPLSSMALLPGFLIGTAATLAIFGGVAVYLLKAKE